VLALVSRPEYKTVQALKGKTVAVLIAGGVAHFAARQIAKHFGLDAEKEDLRLVIDETKKTMKLSRDVPYNEIADLSILREVQRELGTK
jgi:TRAP-type uncharacterized transport system substrate-binding protein